MQMQEGKLAFIFPEDWQVGKYDEWRFYRNRFEKCCGGCKAVDFVAVSTTPRKILWLVEVKDYNQHKRTKAIDLAEEIALKARDSLAGIAAAKFQADDTEEKRLAGKAMQSKKVRVALHLEQPEKHSKLFPRAIDPSKILQKLKPLIKSIDPHPLVVERTDCQIRGGWKAEPAGSKKH
jgi:hypothetical protein